MKLHLAHTSAYLTALAALGPIAAQVDRHEIGLRLRECERQLATITDVSQRRLALTELNRSVRAFFRFDMVGVARNLDATRQAMSGDAADESSTFAHSLQLVIAERLHDPAVDGVAATLSAVYETEVACPDDLRLEVRLLGIDEPILTSKVTGLPFSCTLRATAPAGDYTVQWRLHQGERVLSTRTQGLSVVPDLAARLAAIEVSAKESNDANRSIESETLSMLARLLRGMQRPRREETVLPGLRLLVEAEALADSIARQRPLYSASTTGEHWLRVPIGDSTNTLRLLVPDGPASGPRTLVLALHGAGGSENMFFDGYGDGTIVRLCRERGWMLAAPRSDGVLGANLPLLIEALRSRWSIDPQRVLLIGHSMGAAQAVASASRTPERFRAVAALGGGGFVADDADLHELPFFVGVGEKDFGRSAAESLRRALEAAKAPTTWREYADVEHLSVVQFSLVDVFEFFAAAIAASK